MPPTVVHVELPDVLTASVCSHLAVELFKHIAYQRQQLPFPYKQLNSVLSRRDPEANSVSDDQVRVGGGSATSEGRSFQSIQADNEYRKIRGLFESMEATFQNLQDELCFEEGLVEEVVMILGATPLSPRDVYRIQFPPLLYGHQESKHPHQSSLLNLFRSLISSEELHTFFNQPTPPTNMFLFLRKSSTLLATSGFIPKERFSIPKSGNHAVIRFIPPTILPKCICGGANIYRDINIDREEHPNIPDHGKSIDEPSLNWFQALQTLKGFKDVKLNGTSVFTVWLQSR